MNNYAMVDMYIKESRQQFLNDARLYHKAKAADHSNINYFSILNIFMWLNKNK